MTDFERAIEEAKADNLPFESWERLPAESGAAFSAFCAFRDLGLERNIRKAVESVEHDVALKPKNTMCGGIGRLNTSGGNVRGILTNTLKN